MLSIYYIQCPVLEEVSLREADHLARVINERQRWDWRDLRLRNFRNRNVQLAIEELARKVYEVRRRAVTSLQEFKARLPIADIVGRYVSLTRRGRDLWGCCPFHNEKRGSFHVVPDKGFYHCFGCGAHGNAIDFVMAIEGSSFNQALARLAGMTGLPAPISGGYRASSEPSKSLPQSFEEVVEMFDRLGEPMLHGWLYQAARLVGFEPGRIKLRLAPGTPPDLPARVAAALQRWTRQPWLVVLADETEPTQPTLAEQARTH